VADGRRQLTACAAAYARTAHPRGTWRGRPRARWRGWDGAHATRRATRCAP